MSNNNNNNNNEVVVDLVSSGEEEEVPEQPKHDFLALPVEMHIPMEPYAKPSIRCGPGRGGPGRGGRGRFNGWFRCYTDSKAAAKKELFRGYVSAKVSQIRGFRKYPKSVPVKVEIWCYLRRPDSDFVNKIRGTNRLRWMVAHEVYVPIKPDNDNLAKFLMDGLTGIVFEDDAQVVDLRVIKMRDNQGSCDGRIAISCSRFVPGEDAVDPSF